LNASLLLVLTTKWTGRSRGLVRVDWTDDRMDWSKSRISAGRLDWRPNGLVGVAD